MRGNGGFTLVELVVTMIVVGILAVAVLPRFANVSEFEAAGYADQLAGLVRYTHKTAIAQRRMIYLNFGAVPPQLCASGSATACSVGANCATSGAIVLPGGSFNQPRTTVTLGGTLGTQVCFDGLGRPFNAGGALAVQETILVNDQSGGLAKTIRVDAETGYVRAQ